VGFSNEETGLRVRLVRLEWRSLKHQWLRLHQLDSIATVRRLVEFYVQQHQKVMPHSAFNGATPDEVYFGRTEGVVGSFASGRVIARAERLKVDQTASCPAGRSLVLEFR